MKRIFAKPTSTEEDPTSTEEAYSDFISQRLPPITRQAKKRLFLNRILLKRRERCIGFTSSSAQSFFLRGIPQRE
jgi:hypothetical protein